jgi:hypothetical protein
LVKLHNSDDHKEGDQDIHAAKAKLRAYLSSELRNVYASLIADSKLPEQELTALVETLSRCPGLSPDTVRDIASRMGPSQLYGWALSKSNIAYPCLNLKAAGQQIGSQRAEEISWGYLKPHHYRLPTEIPALLEEETMWIYLFGLAGNYGDIETMESLPGDWVPFPNDVLARDKVLDTVIKRVHELSRNPKSATIRGDLGSPENVAKNAVDFVVLEHILPKLGYTNLSISTTALRSGRRQVQHVDIQKKQTVTSYIGYRLTDILIDGCQAKASAVNREEINFVNFFIGLLHDIADSVSWTELPKSFLEPPAESIRRALRQGPDIRTKKGMKKNFYIPLSYVKSSECARYPDAIRRECTATGSDVMIRVDAINNLSVREANERLPSYKAYMASTYLLADRIRAEWRTNQYVPGSGTVTRFMESLLDEKDGNHPIPPDRAEVTRRVNSIPFHRAYAEPELQEDAKKSVLAALQQKSSRRQGNRR